MANIVTCLLLVFSVCAKAWLTTRRIKNSKSTEKRLFS